MRHQLIAALDGLDLLSKESSPRLEDIIHLLWREARLDNDEKDVESPSIKHEDEIELGLLKLALFGVVFNQRAKLCIPCGNNRKPMYDEKSWVTTSKIRRTNGELVRHDAANCWACKDVMLQCPYSRRDSTV